MTSLTKAPTLPEIGALVREGRKGPQVECGLVHRFTDQMYIRELTVPAGTLICTKYHRSQHPYIISKGSIEVYIPGGTVETLSAPHCGITEPGTIRLARTLSETVWTTFHHNPSNERDPEKLVEALTYDPEVFLDSPELVKEVLDAP